tara:strand:+ start:6417 stop:7772 length:1356 start_codon:yes stop_codon:yes gene_type:complete
MENKEFINDKILPQDIAIEKAVLGAILIESDSLLLVSETLKPETFYDHKNGFIYKAIQELDRLMSKIDMLTVINQLKKNKELDASGGVHYISKLTNSVASSANIETHVVILNEKFMARELIRIASKSMQLAYSNSDVFDIVAEIDKGIMDVTTGIIKKDIKDTKQLVDDYIVDLNKPQTGITGICSGFEKVDSVTGGFQDGELIVLAARPAMGKSALALNMAKNITIDNGKAVAVFSLEMTSKQLMGRFYSDVTGIESWKFKKRELTMPEWGRINDASILLKEIRLFIDDTPSIKLNELRSKCIRLKSKGNLDIVLIDYLQLMRLNYKTGSREQEISEISRGLKAIAKELNVPIIALSQLSRKVEERPDKMPMMSDLRESGAIEQDADIILFLMRPEYYGMNEFNFDGDLINTDGLAHLEVAKNRSGDIGGTILTFQKENVKFENYKNKIY